MEDYTLGMWRASYRDYAGSRISICTAEPRWLQDQLTSVNGVLNRWLEATARAPEETWTHDELSLLEEGARTLPPLVDVHAQNLADVGRCSFAKDRVYPHLRERGAELVAAARARIEQAPRLQAHILAREALALWREERPMREGEARNRCPPKPNPRARPVVYYAWEAEDGRVSWLFCNGARVITPPGGGEPEFDPPPGMHPRDARRIQPRPHIDAAVDYPPEGVDRPPSVPAP
jgi:hypothetical protein